MNGVIEAKLVGGEMMRAAVGGGDQASALRAMIGRGGEAREMRRESAAGPRLDGVLRIAWLVERDCPELRAAIAGIAATVGQRRGVRVAWDTRGGDPAFDVRTGGLLIVCDSCAGASEALRRVRRAVAEGSGHGARTAATNGWIGAVGLTTDPTGRCVLSASLRGLRDTVERLMDEPVQLLGVQRLPRWRGLWLMRCRKSRARALSDELRQVIERFLISRAQSTCAIR